MSTWFADVSEPEESVSLYDVGSLAKYVRKLINHLYNPETVTVIGYNNESYTLGHRKKTALKVYILDDETREMLAEFLIWVAQDVGRALKYQKLLYDLPKRLVELGIAKPANPVRRYKDYGGEDSSWWSESVEMYVVKTPYIRTYTYTPYSAKYSTYLSPVTTYSWGYESMGDNSVFAKIDDDVSRVLSHCPEASKELEARVRRLLEAGYKVEGIKDGVELTVGSTSTSVAWWKANYEVLCGDVEVIEKEVEEDWGWKQIVTIKPRTRAVVKYSSNGSLTSWQNHVIYLLG